MPRLGVNKRVFVRVATDIGTDSGKAYYPSPQLVGCMSPWGVLTSMDFWIGYSIGFILATIIITARDYLPNPDTGIIIHTRGSLNEVAGKVEEALKRVSEAVYREVEGCAIVFDAILDHVNEVRVYEGNDGLIYVFISGFEMRRIARAIRRALQS